MPTVRIHKTWVTETVLVMSDEEFADEQKRAELISECGNDPEFAEWSETRVYDDDTDELLYD